MLQQTFSNALTAAHPQAPQPPHIETPLKPHQLAALHAMRAKEHQFQTGYTIPNTQETLFSSYAFLGDRVGVGKTLMVLGHVSQMATAPLTTPAPGMSNLNPNSTAACFSLFPTKPTENLFDTLIVVPHTIYKQWQDTIKATTLKPLFIKSQRDLDKENLVTSLRSSHLTLVSNTLLAQFMNSVQVARQLAPRWRRVFYDEADSVKIVSTCIRPQANMTWFISASYQNLILANHYYHSYIIRQLQPAFIETLAPELQEMVHAHTNAHPNVTFFRTLSFPFFAEQLKSQLSLRGHLIIRSCDEFINQSVTLPPLVEQIIRCQTPITHQVLGPSIPPETEAMLHAGDVQAALVSLGISQHSPLTIVEAVTSYRTMELDRMKRLLAFKQEETYANPIAKEQAITNLQDKITRLEAQIQGIHERLEQASKEVCAICFDPPAAPVLTPCCSKIFCGQCILRWMMTSTACPLCRTGIHPTDLRQVTDAQPAQHQHQPPPQPQPPKKLDALLKILQENPDGQFLVFSRFDNPLATIQETIEDHYPSQSLHGNKDAVAKQIADFEEGRVKILLLNSRLAAAGLHLPSATHVILLHKMGPEEEKQILGRAYRLGRTKPLQFIKLFHQRE